MEFIQSASALTLRHYALDLKQAFADENSHSGSPVERPLKGKGSRPAGSVAVAFPESLSEEALLVRARATFSNSWGKLSLASRNRKAATLKSFFGWAFQEGLLTKDLATQITCPKVPRKLPHFLSVDEVLAVMKTFKPADRSNSESLLKELQEEVLFYLLYGGGLRVSEACQLRWSNVQANQRILKVLGKGQKERLIVLPQICVTKLLALRKLGQEGEFVFGTKPLDTRHAYEVLRQRGIRAQLLRPLHPHALRHSFATHLLSSGANLRTLQEMLGHESLQATEKYTHLGIDQLARTMEKLHPLGNRRKSG